MPSFTIKQMPKELYTLLQRQAHANNRSMNKELIECLIKALNPEPLDSETILEKARSLRMSIPEKATLSEVRKAMHEGRI